MPDYIALLRGINVGGRNRLAMNDLRKLAASLGMERARTLLQSGNLVFVAERRGSAALEGLLEEAARRELGLSVDFLIRSAAEWDKLIAANPFAKQAQSDPSHLLVMCLKSPPNPADVKSLCAAIRGRESVHADGKQLYLVYPDGIARSKLTNALIESTLDRRGSARNWNTVLKLAAMARES